MERENSVYVQDAYDTALEKKFRGADFEKESGLKKRLAAELFPGKKKISFQALLAEEGMGEKGNSVQTPGRSMAGRQRQHELEIHAPQLSRKPLGR